MYESICEREEKLKNQYNSLIEKKTKKFYKDYQLNKNHQMSQNLQSSNIHYNTENYNSKLKIQNYDHANTTVNFIII